MVLALVFFSSYSKADQTGNILNNTWSGNYGFGYWGGTSGGQIPNLGGSTFYWGYGGGVLSNTIAINNALQEEGVQVEGYSYVWKIKNGNANEYTNQPGIDPMEITVEVYKANGDLYQTYVYDYGYSHDWTAHSGSETFPDQFLDPAFFGNITVKAEGDDSGYWAGWYGPEFNTAQSSLTLTYSSNPCYGNPLYDPACDGYAEAVADFIPSKKRELPEWAQNIFSDSMVAAGNVKTEEEALAIIELALDNLRAYFLEVGDYNGFGDSSLVKAAQNYYAHNQRQNPHTANVMKSLGLPEADVELFCRDALFPDIA